MKTLSVKTISVPGHFHVYLDRSRLTAVFSDVSLTEEQVEEAAVQHTQHEITVRAKYQQERRADEDWNRRVNLARATAGLAPCR